MRVLERKWDALGSDTENAPLILRIEEAEGSSRNKPVECF
jgi:hypothetical protein